MRILHLMSAGNCVGVKQSFCFVFGPAISGIERIEFPRRPGHVHGSGQIQMIHTQIAIVMVGAPCTYSMAPAHSHSPDIRYTLPINDGDSY